jgi:hypothetical protein
MCMRECVEQYEEAYRPNVMLYTVYRPCVKGFYW